MTRKDASAKWAIPIVLAVAAMCIALALSGCGGCYEPTPDGLGITACKGRSW